MQRAYEQRHRQRVVDVMFKRKLTLSCGDLDNRGGILGRPKKMIVGTNPQVPQGRYAERSYSDYKRLVDEFKLAKQ